MNTFKTLIRYEIDRKIPVTFDLLQSCVDEPIIADVYEIGGLMIANVNRTMDVLGGLVGIEKTVLLDFTEIPVGSNYSLVFRTEDTGVIGKGILVILAQDGYSDEAIEGLDIWTEALEAPTLTLVDTNVGFNLSWSPNGTGGEEQYLIRYSTDNITFETIDTVLSNVTTYLDNDFDRLVFGQTAYYSIIAVHATIPISVPSNVVSGQVVLSAPTLVLEDTSVGFDLSWTPNGGELEQFYIIRYSEDNITFITIDTVTSDITTYLDDDFDRIDFGETSYYSVIASYSPSELSSPSNVVSGIVSLPTPSLLAISNLLDTTLTLTWQSNSLGLEDGFEIWRSTTGELGTYSLYATVASTVETLPVTGLTHDTEYWWKVRAIGSVNSDYSSPIGDKTLFAFTFYSNLPAANTVTLQMYYSGGDTPIWIFEDTSQLAGQSITTLGSDVGLDGTTQEVKILFVNPLLVGDIIFGQDTPSKYITGVFDLSEILITADTFNLQTNTVTSIIFKVGSSINDVARFSNNNLIALDLSNVDMQLITGFGYHTNPDLTSITFKSGSTINGGYEGYNCPLLTSLDLSEVNLSISKLLVYGCTLMTSIIFKSGSTISGSLEANDCSLISLDFSLVDLQLTKLLLRNNSLTTVLFQNGSFVNGVSVGFKNNNLSGNLDLSNLLLTLTTGVGAAENPSLTGITFKTGSWFSDYFEVSDCDLGYQNLVPYYNFNSSDLHFLIHNNNMTAAEVNQYLDDADNNTTAGKTTGTINVGGTNAAPDSSSGGYDGTAAVASLVSKGRVVITT